MQELHRNPRPHTLELLRYDFQQDLLTGRWESLAELKRKGCYMRDLRQEAVNFVDACREGKRSVIHRLY